MEPQNNPLWLKFLETVDLKRKLFQIRHLTKRASVNPKSFSIEYVDGEIKEFELDIPPEKHAEVVTQFVNVWRNFEKTIVTDNLE